jgi:solute carrier family 25 protein 44
MATYRGPFDVINKVVRMEGIRGLYRGFGITMLTQSPASALWWSAYSGAQHAIWRCESCDCFV